MKEVETDEKEDPEQRFIRKFKAATAEEQAEMLKMLRLAYQQDDDRPGINTTNKSPN